MYRVTDLKNLTVANGTAQDLYAMIQDNDKWYKRCQKMREIFTGALAMEGKEMDEKNAR